MHASRCHAYLAHLMLFSVLAHTQSASAQATVENYLATGAEKTILDTDIGDDIDDAFALALALRSPELQILQINSAFGDTALRSRLLDRFLDAVDRSDIPVATGIQTALPLVDRFSQRRYAERTAPTRSHPDAIASTLELIRKNPGEITLIAIGPYSNLGAMIDRDPETFRKLKRIVVMGGSFNSGRSDGYSLLGQVPEWNVRGDIPATQKVIASGVPLYMIPLDATQLMKLDEVNRAVLFKEDSLLTDQLLLLYEQWGALTPTLHDPLAVGYAINPKLCPTEPMHIYVDENGYTRTQPGPPNANICLHSDPEEFLSFYMHRLIKPKTSEK
jgi:inosine-uridine nucleoside N-ribohydrolase